MPNFVGLTPGVQGLVRVDAGLGAPGRPDPWVHADPDRRPGRAPTPSPELGEQVEVHVHAGLEQRVDVALATRSSPCTRSPLRASRARARGGPRPATPRRSRRCRGRAGSAGPTGRAAPSARAGAGTAGRDARTPPRARAPARRSGRGRTRTPASRARARSSRRRARRSSGGRRGSRARVVPTTLAWRAG